MKLIQLKQVLDNKRFLLFTIFIPVAWYVFLYNIQQGITPNIMLGIAVFIGIIGNSLATFSKRISSNIDFYSFESKFSKYTVKNYLLDQTLVQLVLNTLIFIVVLAVGVLFFSFPLNSQLVVQFFLLTIMGIYFSIIGFVIGVRLDEKIIDTGQLPSHYFSFYDDYSICISWCRRRIHGVYWEGSNDFPRVLLHQYRECSKFFNEY